MTLRPVTSRRSNRVVSKSLAGGCYEGGPWVPRTGRGATLRVLPYIDRLPFGILLSGYFLMERGGSWVGEFPFYYLLLS